MKNSVVAALALVVITTVGVLAYERSDDAAEGGERGEGGEMVEGRDGGSGGGADRQLRRHPPPVALREEALRQSERSAERVASAVVDEIAGSPDRDADGFDRVQDVPGLKRLVKLSIHALNSGNRDAFRAYYDAMGADDYEEWAEDDILWEYVARQVEFVPSDLRPSEVRVHSLRKTGPRESYRVGPFAKPEIGVGEFGTGGGEKKPRGSTSFHFDFGHLAEADADVLPISFRCRIRQPSGSYTPGIVTLHYVHRPDGYWREGGPWMLWEFHMEGQGSGGSHAPKI